MPTLIRESSDSPRPRAVVSTAGTGGMSGTASGKSNSILMIQPLDNVNKELVFKQRMNRPFKIIQNLPLSKDPGQIPDYSLLNNPLSIKDSSVLYNSLIVSRFNWLNHMFKTYWTRREQLLIGTADLNKKDKMIRFCNPVMSCGTHTFTVKLFFLKDDEKEKIYHEELEKRREERIRKREEKLAEMQRKKEEKEKEIQKLKMEEELKLKQEIIPVKLNENNSAEKLQKEAQSEMINKAETNKSLQLVDKTGTKAENTASDMTSKTVEVLDQNTDKNKNLDKESEGTRLQNDEKLSKDGNSEIVKENAVQSSLLHVPPLPESKEKLEKITDNTPIITSRIIKSPGNIGTTTNICKIDKTKEAAKATGTSQAPLFEKTLTIKKPLVKQKANNNDIMSNPDSAKIIRNLNLLTKKDPNLSILMKKVAEGGASVEEVAEFQTYIQKAKDMKDMSAYISTIKQSSETKESMKKQDLTTKIKVPILTPEEAKARQEFLERRALEIKQEHEKMVLEKKRLKEERERLKKERQDQREKEKLEREEKKRLLKEEKEREKERKRLEKLEQKEVLRKDREEKLRIKQEKLAQKAAEREQEKQRNKEELKEKGTKANTGDDEDDLWNDKLSPLQERYSTGASLVFEFFENQNARFIIPRDTIFEIISNENENGEEINGSISNETKIKTENSSDLKQKMKSPYVTILASFLLVHNQPEIDGWERRRLEEKALKLAELKKKEEEEKLLAAEEEKSTVSTRRKRRKKATWASNKRNTRHSKQQKMMEQLRREEENFQEEDEELRKEEQKDERPIPVYSCVTITLSEIPFRYADFIKNSGNSIDIVKKNMEEIHNVGQKVPLDQLWYHIDGLKDELLGETLRYNLNRLDFTSCGGRTAKNKAMLKKMRNYRT